MQNMSRACCSMCRHSRLAHKSASMPAASAAYQALGRGASASKRVGFGLGRRLCGCRGRCILGWRRQRAAALQLWRRLPARRFGLRGWLLLLLLQWCAVGSCRRAGLAQAPQPGLRLLHGCACCPCCAC